VDKFLVMWDKLGVKKMEIFIFGGMVVVVVVVVVGRCVMS